MGLTKECMEVQEEAVQNVSASPIQPVQSLARYKQACPWWAGPPVNNINDWISNKRNY